MRTRVAVGHVAALALGLLWALHPTDAIGAWQAGGTPICTATNDQEGVVVVADGQGGALLVWADFRNGLTRSNSDIYTQHVTTDGTLYPGWPADGFPVCTAAGHQSGHVAVTDCVGGVLVAWEDQRAGGQYSIPYAQRITSAGTIAPGWPVDGTPLCSVPNGLSTLGIASDGAGGAIVAWTDSRNPAGIRTDIFAQRITGQGVVAPGWPADGVTVCADTLTQQYACVTSDGQGGAIIAWQDKRSGTSADIYALRITSAGAIAPGWPTGGAPLCTEGSDQLYPSIAADGAGGAVVSWHDKRNLTVSLWDVYAQRIDGSGSIAPGWPTNGTLLCAAPGSQMFTQIVSDGTGGAIVSWRDDRNDLYDVYTQRIAADGTIPPGWPADGFGLAVAPGNQSAPTTMPDGVGGVIAAWNDGQSGARIFAQHLTAGATPVPGWPDDGLVLAAGSGPSIASDAFGGAIVGFTRSAGSLDVYAQRVSASGRVSTGVEANALPLLALGPGWPNPFTTVVLLRFELPSTLPVRLDVFDAAGRRVRSLVDGSLPAGTHLLGWDGQSDEATPLAAGAYFVRLRVAGSEVTRKIVRSR